MTVGASDIIIGIAVLLLAVYGCAQGIRRLCLWLTRCPGCAVCCRVAIPREGTAVAPLMRCLQSQAVWGECGCRRILLVLPPLCEEEQRQLVILQKETPAVIPVTAPQLHAMLQQLVAEQQRDKDN